MPGPINDISGREVYRTLIDGTVALALDAANPGALTVRELARRAGGGSPIVGGAVVGGRFTAGLRFDVAPGFDGPGLG